MGLDVRRLPQAAFRLVGAMEDVLAETAAISRWRRWLVVAVALGLVALDQLSKWLVVTHLVPGQSVRVCAILDFTYSHNRGVAFGLWSQGGILLPIVAMICIVALLFGGRQYASRSALVMWALALLVGGALGNLFDRIRLGYVVDFIDFRFWPVFNIADTGIVIGALLLLLYGVFFHDDSRDRARPPAPEEGGA